MTKAERDALASLVRQRFKLLRHDIQVRRAEMTADLDHRLDDQFAGAAKDWDDAQFLVKQARDDCNRQVNDLLRAVCKKVGHDYPDASDYDIVMIRDVGNPVPARKAAARKQAIADIDAIEMQAFHELASQENTLLTDLLTGSLESAEARAFISRIPSVSSLMVSTARLEALVGPEDPS